MLLFLTLIHIWQPSRFEPDLLSFINSFTFYSTSLDDIDNSVTCYYRPPEGGRLYDMKVVSGYAFLQTYFIKKKLTANHAAAISHKNWYETALEKLDCLGFLDGGYIATRLV